MGRRSSPRQRHPRSVQWWASAARVGASHASGALEMLEGYFDLRSACTPDTRCRQQERSSRRSEHKTHRNELVGVEFSEPPFKVSRSNSKLGLG